MTLALPLQPAADDAEGVPDGVVDWAFVDALVDLEGVAEGVGD